MSLFTQAACFGIWQLLQTDIDSSVGTLDIGALVNIAFPLWIDKNTTMTLAQAGRYEGPANIREYASFTSADSPYVDELKDLSRSFPSYNLADPENGVCEFILHSTSEFRSNPEFSTGHTAYVGQMFKVIFSLPDNAITNIHVYYTAEWNEFTFSTALGGDNTKGFVCDVMASEDCGDIYQLNGSPSKEACIQRLGELPFTDGPLHYFDGNSQGCRAMHATFAQQNPVHCAHLSFVEAVDPEGNIKCQKSKEIAIDSLFTSQEVTQFKNYCATEPLLGTSDCYRITAGPPLTATTPPTTSPTDSSSDAEMSSSLEGWQIVVTFLVSLAVAMS